MKSARKFVLAGLTIALAGCAGGGLNSPRLAGAAYCPAGTVKVCTGLYEPERELAPSCACADLVSSR